jgi:WD40 repeat protein
MLTIHDPETDRMLEKPRPEQGIFDIDPSGRILIVAKTTPEAELELRSLNGDQLITTLKGTAMAREAQFISPDRLILYSQLAKGGGELSEWNRVGEKTRALEISFSGESPGVRFDIHHRFVALYLDRTCEIRRVDDFSLISRVPDHTEAILSTDFSSDGASLVTGSQDGTLRVFDVASGKLKRHILGHPRFAMSVAFMSDNKRIISVDSFGVVKVWPGEPMEPVQTIVDAKAMWSNISRDGKHLLWVGPGGTLSSQDLVTGKRAVRSFGQSNISLNRNSDWVFVGLPNGQVRSVDPVTLRDRKVVQIYGKKDIVHPYAILPGGKVLVTFLSGEQALNGNTLIDRRKTYSVVDTETLQVSARFTTPHWVGAPRFGFSKDGRVVAFSGINDKNVLLFRVEDGRLLRKWEFPCRVYGQAISPDGSLIAISLADAYGSPNATVEMFRVDTGRRVGPVDYSGLVIGGLRFSNGGDCLVGSNRTGSGFIWETASRKLRTKLTSGADVRDIYFSPDDERIVTSGVGENSVTIWDAHNGAELMTLPLSTRDQEITPREAPRFSPDGRRITVTGSDGAIRIWNSAPLKPMSDGRTQKLLVTRDSKNRR